MLRLAFRLACCFVFSTLLAQCSSSGASGPPVRLSTGPYSLRTSDQVRIQVYGEPTITGDYTVDTSGFVSVPMAGRVKAAGLTTGQLERNIAARFNNGILKDAHVNVQVSVFSPFYILGEVKKPGEFPYRPGLTVGDAVALAGGYTYRADESKVYVRPGGSAGEVSRSVGPNAPIEPGDNVRIPERLF